MSGAKRIKVERDRQVAVEGYDSYHDDQHSDRALATGDEIAGEAGPVGCGPTRREPSSQDQRVIAGPANPTPATGATFDHLSAGDALRARLAGSPACDKCNHPSHIGACLHCDCVGTHRHLCRENGQVKPWLESMCSDCDNYDAPHPAPPADGEGEDATADLEAAERHSAVEAFTVLAKALGWSSGGLASAALEVVDRLTAATQRAERAEEEVDTLNVALGQRNDIIETQHAEIARLKGAVDYEEVVEKAKAVIASADTRADGWPPSLSSVDALRSVVGK